MAGEALDRPRRYGVRPSLLGSVQSTQAPAPASCRSLTDTAGEIKIERRGRDWRIGAVPSPTRGQAGGNASTVRPGPARTGLALPDRPRIVPVDRQTDRWRRIPGVFR